ncbi:hypothetical protein Sango_1138700 [Sesamum angolense]|uniref:Uncharacterized protein n=1 Tax=Sesamum angolense TaxID=2727404 RepID=A0AAE2BWE9_9LAMI|nr:hypothetical protein Sango_1138700 [Sesamum angolense]
MTAKDLVRAGSRWRIGSSHSVSAWQDPWLPRAPSFRAITHLLQGESSLLVYALITETNREWNVVVITNLFWPEGQDLILQIPLSSITRLDWLLWHYSKNGLFSIRSAYHLAHSLKYHAGTSEGCWNWGL